jgi:hypothetical protein
MAVFSVREVCFCLAGGVGINLAVIIVDPDYNSHQDVTRLSGLDARTGSYEGPGQEYGRRG